MENINVNVADRIAVADADSLIVCGNADYQITFTFDDDWAGVAAKTARFSYNGTYTDVAFSGNVVTAPPIANSDYVEVGVFSADLTTTPARIPCRRSIKCRGGDVTTPPQSVYDQIISIVNEGMESAEEIANEALTAVNTAINEIDELQTDVIALETFEPKSYTATGNPVTLDNYEGMPLNVVSAFEPVQAGEGEPYPAGGGKNLLDIDHVAAGNCIVNADGSITSNIQNGYFININVDSLNDVLFANRGNPITFHVEGNEGKDISIIIYGQTTDGSNIQETNAYGSAVSCTISETFLNISYVELRFNRKWEPFTDTIGVFRNIQLEFGSVATEYAPYANIRPISGRTGAELVRCGKNLFDPNCQLTGSSVYKWHKISVKPNTRYTFMNFKGGNLFGTGYGAAFTSAPYNGETQDGVYDWIGHSGNSTYVGYGVFTTDGSGELYFSFYGDTGRVSELLGELYLIEGDYAKSKMPAFEPYAGNAYAVQFGQTVYGGTLDWGTGKLTAQWALRQFDGTEDWLFHQGYVHTTGFEGVGGPVSGGLDAVMSHYSRSYQIFWNNMEDMSFLFGADTWSMSTHILIRDSLNSTSQEAWKAYLAAQSASGTPVQLAYKLAEPVTIQLPPNDIRALQGENHLFTDAGKLTVSGRNDILWLTSDLLARNKALEARVAALENQSS